MYRMGGGQHDGSQDKVGFLRVETWATLCLDGRARRGGLVRVEVAQCSGCCKLSGGLDWEGVDVVGWGRARLWGGGQ